VQDPPTILVQVDTYCGRWRSLRMAARQNSSRR
jgi:hypothetical protein